LIRKAFSLLAVLSLACAAGTASAQTDTPPTKLDKQLHKLDLSVNVVGEYNRTVTGTVVPSTTDTGLPITQFGSNTAGALVALHYVPRPYVGFELNYGYARYTENYEGVAIQTALDTTNFQAQAKVNEYTFGYLVTPPHPVFGLQPFASAGYGVLAFKPTAGGGQELPEKARAEYYYSLGLQKDYGHLGLRAGFRELFFLAPDFGQNYLTILKHTTTYEPMAGFYFRY
jgi:hypothetical protein